MTKNNENHLSWQLFHFWWHTNMRVICKTYSNISPYENSINSHFILSSWLHYSSFCHSRKSRHHGIIQQNHWAKTAHASKGTFQKYFKLLDSNLLGSSLLQQWKFDGWNHINQHRRSNKVNLEYKIAVWSYSKYTFRFEFEWTTSNAESCDVFDGKIHFDVH